MLKVGNIIGECWKLEKQIGFGASGKIFKSTHTRTKEIRAIKAIQKIDDSTDNSNISSDIQIGMELGKICPDLVRYYNVFYEGDHQFIIMDYFENGDLQSYLQKKGGKLNEKV
jgi:serine/threonine protein kinase